MKFILVIFLSCLLSSCAKQVRIYDKGIHTAQIKPIPIEQPFREIKCGEKLNYDIDWIGIPAGNITLEVKEISRLGGYSVYHVIAKAIPNKFFKFFHNVEYTVHSYIDISSMRSVRFYKERLLNGKLTKEEIDFDYNNNEAIWRYFNPEKSNKIKMPPNNQDLLSALYAFRVENIRLGETYKINIIYGGVVWPVNITIDREEEIQVAKNGNFKVIVGKLSSRLNNHITGFDNIEVYMSIDKSRLPILFRMRTKIGYLSGILSSDK